MRNIPLVMRHERDPWPVLGASSPSWIVEYLGPQNKGPQILDGAI